MLDFPQFARDTFPGVTHMDLFSGLFGDVADDGVPFAGRTFDPMTSSGRKWLDQLGGQDGGHRSEVPAHLQQRADHSGRPGRGGPQGGMAMAKRWLEGCAVLGVKSMRMNSTSALGPGIRPNAIPRGPGDGYPRNVDIVPMLTAAIGLVQGDG